MFKSIFNRFIFKTLKKPCTKWQKCLFVCNKGDTIHYWTQTNYDALLHLSMSTTDSTIQYQGGLQTRKLGQAPILLFLTLRQTLSSHPRLQMVWLCRLQDRDSIHKHTCDFASTVAVKTLSWRPWKCWAPLRWRHLHLQWVLQSSAVCNAA